MLKLAQENADGTAMINGLDSALQGLLQAEDRLAQAAERVSRGDFGAEALVNVKLQSHDFQAQAKNLKEMLESDKRLLDLLA